MHMLEVQYLNVFSNCYFCMGNQATRLETKTAVM